MSGQRKLEDIRDHIEQLQTRIEYIETVKLKRLKERVNALKAEHNEVKTAMISDTARVRFEEWRKKNDTLPTMPEGVLMDREMSDLEMDCPSCLCFKYSGYKIPPDVWCDCMGPDFRCVACGKFAGHHRYCKNHRI